MAEKLNIIQIHGTKINFPYQSPYTAQTQLMAKVIMALSKKQNAILESPTGSGKSLAILCSVLAWHKTNFPMEMPTNLPNQPSAENDFVAVKPCKPPKIIFTSRTHGQLQQLIAEYRRTNYASYFQMVVLASRKQLCINSKIQGLHDRNEQCRKAVDNNDCRYNRGRGYSECLKKANKFSHGTAFDIEDLVNTGQKMSCCPYYGTRAILEHANIIFCPYNYILDPMIRHEMKIDISNAIIIIDEAHNVEDVCRSALTKAYTLEELQFSMDELARLMKLVRVKAMDVWESMSEIKELINMVHSWMKQLDDDLNTNDYKGHRNVFPHPESGANKIRDIMRVKWEYDAKKSAEYTNHAQTVFRYFQEQKKEQNEMDLELNGGENGVTTHGKKAKLAGPAAVVVEYFCIYLFPQLLQSETDFNVALLPENNVWDPALKRKVKKVYLHFWCLSPSVVFKPIAEKVHSVILTSGTLSPLDAMAYELKCKFQQRLVADHVIEKGQVLITAIDRGVNGNQIKCVYNNLQNPALQNDIGSSLIHLFEHIPQGIVVFFPSYATMQTLIDRWMESDIYEKMVNIKKIYTEPKGSDEEATKQFMTAIETFGRDCGNIKYINKYKRSSEYRKEVQIRKKQQESAQKSGPITKYLQSQKKDYSFNAKKENKTEDIDLLPIKCEKGAVFFGVCRGKISEGIDFSDGMSRAVILVGIPYPNQKDSQIHFKKKYNDREAQKTKAKFFGKSNVSLPVIVDGKAWYTLQAYRALNQALGRCIRHRCDYGAIIFLESRFYGSSLSTQKNINQLSKWVRPYIRNSLSVQMAVRDLIKPYFEYMDKNPPRINTPQTAKWLPPFEMPTNSWSKPNNHRNHNNGYRSSRTTNRFFTQSAANNNNNVSNMKKESFTQSPANNHKESNMNKSLEQFKFNNNSNVAAKSRSARSALAGKQHNANGKDVKFSFNGENKSNLNRKRKYEEIHKENDNPLMNKRVKLEVNNNAVNAEPNCVQCGDCSAMICRGKFNNIELDRGGGILQEFVGSHQEFPCDTAKDCLWSSQLGLTFMYKYCAGCRKSVGFHVVGAMTKDRLQYVGQILFIAGAVNLLTIR